MKKFTFYILVIGMIVAFSCSSKPTPGNELRDKDRAFIEKIKAGKVGGESANKEEVEAKEATEAVQEEMEDKTNMEKKKDMTTGGTIKFAAANDRYSAEGDFKKWNFTKVNMEGDDLATLKAGISIDLTSIWENSPKLTDHLKAPDFFNIEKYTTATIDIMNVKSKGDNMYTADMQLNMKGLSQEMVSEFTVTSMDPLHVQGTADINRTLFGLGGEIGVGDFVTVTYDTDVPR